MAFMGSYAHVGPKDLQTAVAGVLKEFSEDVYRSTEEGLDAAEKVLIENLKAASPRKSGKFAKRWKSTGKKYKLSRYVHNTTMVPGKHGNGEVPLSSILEYSPERGSPFIAEVFEQSIEAMGQAIISKLKG